jgi:hypothetical protein
MSIEQIKAVSQNDGLMNFIIGKIWLNPGRGGQVIIDRDNPADIILTPGMKINLTDQTGKKREGKADADFSVSILLPEQQAIELIEKKKALIANRNNKSEE